MKDAKEVTKVKKGTPTLATSGSNQVTEQTVGGTITDTATITGGNSPTGTITFQVYAPGDTSCGTPLDWGQSTFPKTVTLSDEQATSPAFTTDTVSTYRQVT